MNAASPAESGRPPSEEDALRVVLDASALLAYLHQEPGHETAGAVFPGAAISSVNWSEVVQEALSRGVDVSGLRDDLAALGLTVIPFDAADTEAAAHLWAQTHALGLSLGDRACLAPGVRLNARVYTADRAWRRARLPISIQPIR